MSSTWPAGVLTPGLPSPNLTIDQADSVYKLAAECQALGIKLAKKFQVLFGLEAIDHNSIQGTVHEMLTMGCSAQEATYLAIIQDRVPDDECKATTHCPCSEANVAWKEMHEVMYNHQLHYDRQLAMFLTDTEMALNNMRGEVWDAIHALAESESIMYDACLGITLQVLNLLPQIPIDISLHTQIPLTIAYCLESSVYGKWCPKQAAFHLSSRKSGCPALSLRSWVESHINQVRVWGDPPLLLPWTTPWVLVGHRALDIELMAIHPCAQLMIRLWGLCGWSPLHSFPSH